MPLANIFTEEVEFKVIKRVNNLNKDSQGQWGKMSVSQMLTHCNVTFEMTYDDIHSNPTGLRKFIMRYLIKDRIVNETPYHKNGRTAPQFVMTASKDFQLEKNRFTDYVIKTQELGKHYFDKKESHSFEVLNKTE